MLHVVSDDELGFYGQRRRSATVVDVDRQQFIRTAGAVMALPWLDLFAPNTPTPIPSKVTLTEIDQIRSTAKVFWSGPTRTAAVWLARQCLPNCAGLLTSCTLTAMRDSYPRYSLRSRSWARSLASWRSTPTHTKTAGAPFVSHWHAPSKQRTGSSRASVLTGLARQAVWLNEPDDGLTFVELALVRPDRLTATERAMLHTVRARALAKIRRVQECLAAVGAADDAFAHSKPTEDPPWMTFYDSAQHHGDTAHALFDLGIHSRKTQAAPRLAYSVAHHSPTFARSRAISRTKLASLVMATGDPRRAASIGLAALDSVGSLRSRRAMDDLWELHRFSGKHPQIGEARDLRDRISEAFPTSDQAHRRGTSNGVRDGGR